MTSEDDIPLSSDEDFVDEFDDEMCPNCGEYSEECTCQEDAP